MSIVAIVNLAERLLNHSSEQGHDASTTAKAAAKTNSAQPSNLAFEDQFTSSVNGPLTGQEPGLFRVNRFALFSAAANFFLAQRPDAAPAPAETPSAAKIQRPAASEEPPAVRSVNAVNSTNLSPVAAVPVPTTQPVAATESARTQVANTGGPTPIQAPAQTEEVQAATSIPQTASSSAQPNAQSQLQTLNSALAALGLSAADIAVVDRIAALIKDFNPTAFSSLVQQLEFLAQSRAPAVANAPSGSALANPSNGLQIQELIVRFSAVNETLQSGNPKTGAGTTVEVSAFNLQIEGVRITFTNHAGQTVQVETPPAAAGGNAQTSSPNTKARAASA